MGLFGSYIQSVKEVTASCYIPLGIFQMLLVAPITLAVLYPLRDCLVSADRFFYLFRVLYPLLDCLNNLRSTKPSKTVLYPKRDCLVETINHTELVSALYPIRDCLNRN